MSRYFENTPGVQRFIKAGEKLCALFPEFTVLWYRVRSIKSEPTLPTAAIDRQYNVFVNEKFVLELSEDELLFVVAHEIFHPVLGHFERARALGIIDEKGHAKFPASASLWNQATDMVINRALSLLKFQIPEQGLLPPYDYTGELDAESLWEYLKGPETLEKEKKKKTKGLPMGNGRRGDDEPRPGAGCGMRPSEGAGDDEYSDDVMKARNELAEVMRSMGRGANVYGLFANQVKQLENWEKLLRGAFSGTNTKKGYNEASYARPKRAGDGLLPRYKDTVPTLAICIDTSGSMSQKELEKIVNKTVSLCRTYPSVRALLVTHTDVVNYCGFITGSVSVEAISKACSFTGGTQVKPAYDRVRELVGRKTDWLVHFTDCFIENPWPEVPAKRLFIGDFGNAHGTKPPKNAKVLKCG